MHALHAQHRETVQRPRGGSEQLPQGRGGGGSGRKECDIDGFVAGRLADNELQGDMRDADVDRVGAPQHVGGDDIGERDVDVVPADGAHGGDSSFGRETYIAGRNPDGVLIGEHDRGRVRDNGEIIVERSAAFHFSDNGP